MSGAGTAATPVGPNGKYTGGTAIGQAFILLHELGHALSAADFRSDFGNKENGAHNDNLIERNCSNTLRRFQ
jgi:hypothetical protein